MKSTEQIMNSKSLNILAWPFHIYNDKKERANSINSFKKFLSETSCWTTYNVSEKKEDYLLYEDYSYLSGSNQDAFMLYQYFDEDARAVFMNGNNSVCSIYTYKSDCLENLYYYIQTKNDKEYRLPIDAIELHIYSFGVGIILIQLHNNVYKNIDEIKIINDLIRRIKNPLLTGYYMCPVKIGIQKCINENGSLKTVFEEITDYTIQENQTSATREMLDGPDFFYKIVMGTLGCEMCNESDEFTLKGLADDRMYEIVMIRDNSLSNQIIKKQDDDEWRDELYAIGYLDPSESMCQSKDYREQLFQESLYRRWEQYGTLTCINEYAMVCITDENYENNNSVVKPFLNIYAYLVSLTLAQRLGISFYSIAIGKLTKKVSKKGIIGIIQSKELVKYQTRYSVFKNQLLILEASTQQQGIELYKKLQKQLFICEEREILNEEIQSLYEVSTVSFDRRITVWGLIIALIAIVVDVIVGSGLFSRTIEWISNLIH